MSPRMLAAALCASALSTEAHSTTSYDQTLVRLAHPVVQSLSGSYDITVDVIGPLPASALDVVACTLSHSANGVNTWSGTTMSFRRTAGGGFRGSAGSQVLSRLGGVYPTSTGLPTFIRADCVLAGSPGQPFSTPALRLPGSGDLPTSAPPSAHGRPIRPANRAHQARAAAAQLPTIQSVDKLTPAQWDSAVTSAYASAPRTLPSVARSPGGPLPRGGVGEGPVLDVLQGDVILLHGYGFGPWAGQATMSSHALDVQYWLTGSYRNGNPGLQCVATPWAGRGASGVVPNCNGALDHPTEGEMPVEGSILWWSDAMVAFRAPPSAPGHLEVVLSLGAAPNTTSTLASKAGWWDHHVLLRYGGVYNVTTLTRVNDAATVGGTVMRLTSPGFALPPGGAVSATAYTYPVPLPATYAALLDAPVVQHAMTVFHLVSLDRSGNAIPGGMDACAQTAASGGSSMALFGPTSPVPVNCRRAAWAASAITAVYRGTAGGVGTMDVPLPHGSGVGVSILAQLIDVIPAWDAAGGMGAPDLVPAKRIARNTTVGVGGVGADEPLVFSYALPRLSSTLCSSDPSLTACVSSRVFVIDTWLSSVANAPITIRADNMGVEETGACTTAGYGNGGAGGTLTLTVTLTPAGAYQPPQGTLYNVIPSLGSALPKSKDGAAAYPNCSFVVGTSGKMPNIATGRYGLRLTAASAGGNRVSELLPADGQALGFTCGAGYFALFGNLCRSCSGMQGVTCPGGSVSAWDGTAAGEGSLAAPIIPGAGWYNFMGAEASGCPFGTPSSQRPTGSGVCIVQCPFAPGCTGGNVCAAGYVSEPPAYACSKCSGGYSRVDATLCGSASPALTSSDGSCVQDAVCSAGGGKLSLPASGGNGEYRCTCEAGPAATPSTTPSPSTTPGPATATGTASAAVVGSATPTPSTTATSSGSASPSGTATPSASPSPSPSAPPTTCADGVKSEGETDVDCGGGRASGGCTRCGSGLRCVSSTDCIGEGGGAASDAVCDSASGRCADVRLGYTFWASHLRSTNPALAASPNAPTHTVFGLHFNVSLAPLSVANATLALSPLGLDVFASALSSVAAVALGSSPGVDGHSLTVLSAAVTVSRVTRGRGAPSPFNASITVYVMVGPASGANSTWHSAVTRAGDAGVLSASTLGSRLATRLSTRAGLGAEESAWASAASSPSFLLASTSAVGAPSTLPVLTSVEAAAAAAPPRAGGGSSAAAPVIVLLLLGGYAYAMYCLRTTGEFCGQRRKRVATCCGVWPLDARVAAEQRERHAERRGRKGVGSTTLEASMKYLQSASPLGGGGGQGPLSGPSASAHKPAPRLHDPLSPFERYGVEAGGGGKAGGSSLTSAPSFKKQNFGPSPIGGGSSRVLATPQAARSSTSLTAAASYRSAFPYQRSPGGAYSQGTGV